VNKAPAFQLSCKESILRSIDTLQRVYAVIAGLSIQEALRNAFRGSTGFQLQFDPPKLAQFLAFMLVVIPFVHGTSRHMDATASQNRLKLLFFDFLVFLTQSCMLFLLAEAGSVEDFVSLLILLLTIDAGWSLIASLTKSQVWKWAVINTCAIVLLIILRAYTPFLQPFPIAVIMIARTIADYSWMRKFYFPDD
jgi:hypothetical protein